MAAAPPYVAVVGAGGAYGTLSEIALALKAAKVVVGLRSWEIAGVRAAADGRAAVALALDGCTGES